MGMEGSMTLRDSNQFRVGFIALVLAGGLVGCGLAKQSDTPPATSGDAPVFEIGHGATPATDPDPARAGNAVIQIDNTGDYGVIQRHVALDGLASLDDHLTLSYRFEGAKTCDGGTPRVNLAVDADGNGFNEDNPVAPDGWAYGRLAPDGTCLSGQWQTVDMTDTVGRWSLGAFGGGAFATWAEMVALLDADHPGYRVVEIELVEDGPITGSAAGVTYYDDLTFGDRTLSDHGDVAP